MGIAADAQVTQARQPVLIQLYSRYYDHAHAQPLQERIFRSLLLLKNLKKQYPNVPVPVLMQFSGSVSQVLAELDTQTHEVQNIKDAAREGLVEIGYTGEDEPSYLTRPRPKLLLADTAEKRWEAIEAATERFLTDYKNPVTGEPVDGLTGGLKRMQEVFGEAAYISGVTEPVSGDSPALHVLSKYNRNAVLTGIPVADLRRNIEGFGRGADNIVKLLSPDPNTSPELTWESGRLRLNDTSTTDNKPHSTDEHPKALKEFFDKLDRSRVRVVRLEFATYARYLLKRADGSIKYDPMEWLYYHPDEPEMPLTLKALVDQSDIEKGYRNEEAVMKWLIEEFLPANPGSRFVGINDLRDMAREGRSVEITRQELKQGAENLMGDLKAQFTQTPNYMKAGNRYFSVAEAFQLLATALGEMHRTGVAPERVKAVQMYGPLVIPADMGPRNGTANVAGVMEAAEVLAKQLNDDQWRPIPSNCIPPSIPVGNLRVNAAQFLKLMVDAYLDPQPARVLPLNAVTMFSTITYVYPKNTMMLDQGNTWTVKPAVLRLPSGAARSSAGF